MAGVNIMAQGTCNNCGKDVEWDGSRGRKIANVRCPACGGSVKGKTRGMPGKNLGRKMKLCSVCGKKAYLFLYPQEPYRVARHSELTGENRVYPAGSPCCSTHDPQELDYHDPLSIDDKEEWAKAMNRHERFLHAARGGKGMIIVWLPDLTYRKEEP
jgi:hypothetical protein